MFSASFYVKMNKFASFYVIFAFWSIELEDFYVNLPSQSERNAKTYCSIVTQSPPLIYEQTFIIGTATQTGAAFPYLKVACGEPRVVWRMSAPLA